MKTIYLGITAFLFAFTVQAQNQNVTGTTKTTVTTVKDSEGAKTQVKEQTTQEVQDIKFKETAGDPLNKEMATTPVQVVSTTQVTNPDGSTRTVNVDRSAYYQGNGAKYKLSLDPSGYTMSTGTNSKPALLRRTSTNSYIYRTKDKTAIGYFDTNGNLVIETYDDKSDKVNVETYNRVK
jgi:hypothetical protein